MSLNIEQYTNNAFLFDSLKQSIQRSIFQRMQNDC